MSGLVTEAMDNHKTIISTWLSGKSKPARDKLLSELGQKMNSTQDIPVEGIIEQLAAVLLSACAHDLDLSSLELVGLLRTPRKDALDGLVTVLHNDA